MISAGEARQRTEEVLVVLNDKKAVEQLKSIDRAILRAIDEGVSYVMIGSLILSNKEILLNLGYEFNYDYEDGIVISW